MWTDSTASVGPKKGLGLNHLDLYTSQQLTNELARLCFCDPTIIRHQPPFNLSRGMNNTRLTSAEAVLLHRSHVQTCLNITISAEQHRKKEKAGKITQVEGVRGGWISPAPAASS